MVGLGLGLAGVFSAGIFLAVGVFLAVVVFSAGIFSAVGVFSAVFFLAVGVFSAGGSVLGEFLLVVLLLVVDPSWGFLGLFPFPPNNDWDFLRPFPQYTFRVLLEVLLQRCLYSEGK